MEEIKLDPSSSSRPTISFPLGVALLVIMLLLITAVFLCCLYWDRLRSYLLSTSSTTSHSQQHSNTASSDNIVSVQSDFAHEKPIDRPHHTMEMQNDHVKSVTVVMPGDDVPKFIGMACPCKPPAPDKITVVLHKTLN